MPVGVTDDHDMLRSAVGGWASRHCTREVLRAALEASDDALPPFWGALAAQGWLGLAVPEALGGQGAGVTELAVVCEELGRVLVPGPVLATMTAVTVAWRGLGARAGAMVDQVRSGQASACMAFDAAAALDAAGTGLHITGALAAVPGASTASWGVVPATGSDGPVWCLVALRAPDGAPCPGVSVAPRASLDPTQRPVAVRLDRAAVDPGHVFGPGSGPAELALVLASAHLCGMARWCLDVAAGHARTRVQFGRTIGQYQGVKHRLADLLMAVEQMAAATWDAAAALDAGDPGQAAPAAAAAGALCLEGGVRAARDAIQVLGAIGFSWDHDVHLYLRRAATLRQLHGGPGRWRAAVAARRMAGARRVVRVGVPEALAAPLRVELAPLVAEVAAAPQADRARLLGERGLLFPHWPAPYGRAAGPTEHLVIDELLSQAGLVRPPADSSVWALATVISHGTPEQRRRWAMPTLRRQLVWCQLYSEPGAGSDLAALSTRAEQVEGGWTLTGQKVWTSWADQADLGICLARTGPAVPKHAGITYFVVDMRAPGVQVRPLREMTGDRGFAEVFLDGVFVPDDCVIGEVGEGWGLARTTLAFERMGRSSVSDGELDDIAASVRDASPAPDGATVDALGRLVADAWSLAAMDDRATLRSVAGAAPGPEASVRKLMVAEHDQRVSDLGLAVLGAEGVYADGAATAWSHAFLHRPCLTISGGTSEIQRNLIGERLLGLARDPDPTT